MSGKLSPFSGRHEVLTVNTQKPSVKFRVWYSKKNEKLDPELECVSTIWGDTSWRFHQRYNTQCSEQSRAIQWNFITIRNPANTCSCTPSIWNSKLRKRLAKHSPMFVGTHYFQADPEGHLFSNSWQWHICLNTNRKRQIPYFSVAWCLRPQADSCGFTIDCITRPSKQLTIKRNRRCTIYWRDTCNKKATNTVPITLWTFSFHLQILHVFSFSSLKLQYCRTIVLLSFSKKPLIRKRRWSCDFRPRQLLKSTRRFPAKKRWHSPPPIGLSWDSLPLPRVCMGGRTLTSQPKFLGSIAYQICLAMELRYKFEDTPSWWWRLSSFDVSNHYLGKTLW